VLVEPLDRVLVEAVELLAHPRRYALQEVLGQERNVLGPFLEARDPDRDDGQTVVEILAEFPLPHEGGEVSIGGADEAEIHLDLLVAAHRPHDAILERSEQLLT
jgi:hypothetical protein